MSKAQQQNDKSATPGGGMDLDSIGDLSALLNPAVGGEQGPLDILLDLIDEDPNQPRTADNPGFSEDSIAEIGSTIKARNVKSPISIRENPESPGRYIINHGARRYRGSKWAGKLSIPAFIDNDYNEADQVIENLQRNDLTAREIADFIGRELARGKKKNQIAKEIGKSNSFVSQHVVLLELPEPIAAAFNVGRINDVSAVNDLVVAYKKAPEEVEAWLEDESNQEITRGNVKLLREFLDDKSGGSSDNTDNTGGDNQENGGDEKNPENKQEGGKEKDPNKLSKAIVQVEHDGRLGRLMLNRRPSEAGRAWMKYEDDGQEFEAVLSDVSITQLLEG